MSARSNRRPKGVTIVSLALFWLSISAIGNFVVLNWIQSANPFPPASPGARIASAVTSPSCLTLVAFYGITALVAAVATWRMLLWMPLAFLVWSISALLLGMFLLLVSPSEIILGGKPAAAAFVLGMAVVLWLLYRYVHRVASAASNAVL